MAGFKMKVTPEIENLTEICKDHSSLDLSLYQKYDVKRGLRDVNGKGVLAGLTQISNVCATKVVDGKEVPCAGSLSYRGYDIKELTSKANLRGGCHPVIITIFERVHTALNLAEDAGLAGRVEVWDIQQFLSSNVYEHSLFDESKRNSTLSDIIGRYNEIVLEAETDPSLRIEFEAR